MKRRAFIAGLGGMVAWPLAAWGQQPKMPVVGYLHGGSPETSREAVAGVRRGLAEAGYVEGRGVAIEYRWADDHYDRLPALVADLVQHQVAVIVTENTPAALAAKAGTNSIPIVFGIGTDPIDVGLVTRLNRPEGNITGQTSLIRTTSAKRLQLLYELVPVAASIGFLVNPGNRLVAEPETRDLQAAADTLRVSLLIVNASDLGEFDAAFATFLREGVGGLVIGSDALFYNHPAELVALANRNRIPTIFYRGEAMAAGGLMMAKKDKPKALPLLAPAPKKEAPPIRSIAIQMKPEGWRALRDLALDLNTSLQKLGIEAFNDLMAKHGRKQKIESAWD